MPTSSIGRPICVRNAAIASASDATFPSFTTLRPSSTTQTDVSFNDTSSPAKCFMSVLQSASLLRGTTPSSRQLGKQSTYRHKHRRSRTRLPHLMYLGQAVQARIARGNIQREWTREMEDKGEQ